MERICPFLALAADGRSVVDAYDPAHHCYAIAEPDALDRPTQLQLCLTEAHRRCERYSAAMAARLGASGGRRPEPDVAFERTRLVLEPDPAWRAIGRSSAGASARLIGVAAGTAAAGVTLAAVALAGPGGPVFGPGNGSASPTPTAAPSAPPSEGIDETPAASASAGSSQVPTAVPSPPASAAASQTLYVVQSDDTLGSIATQFGTTVEAIMAANGLTDPNVINVGQVLVIP